MSATLTDAILAMDEPEALAIVQDRLDEGSPPQEILDDARAAMTVLGEKFSCEEVFVPELIMGGEIMKSISQAVMPEGDEPDTEGAKGTVVIGTVQGDIHDIGKDIVVLMLRIGGYTVHDLGTDVPVEDFVVAIKQHDAGIVALSGLLTLAFDAMKSTVDGIAAAGLRDRVKIMIGGAPVDENVRAYTGADGWGGDVGRAIKLADEWTDGGA